MPNDKGGTISSQFKKLPPEVRDYLLDPDELDKLDTVYESLRLTEEQQDKMDDLLWNGFFKIFPLTDFPKKIQTELGVDEAMAKQITIEVVGTRFLPVAAYAGDVSGTIKSWGGDPSKFKGNKIDVRELAPNEFVEEVLAFIGISITDPRLRRRLETTVEAYVNEVRDKKATVGRLTRPSKVGGMEMTAEQATKLLEWVDQKRSWVKISYEKKWERDNGEESKKQAPQISKKQEQIKQDKVIRRDTSLGHLARQATAKGQPMGETNVSGIQPVKPEPKKQDKVIRRGTLNVPDTHPKKPVEKKEVVAKPTVIKKDLDIVLREDDIAELTKNRKKLEKIAPKILQSDNEIVNKIVSSSGIQFSTKEKRKRFESLVLARIKNVRNSLQTKRILERGYELGGMGLSGGVLVKIVELIEAEVDKKNQTYQKQQTKGKADYVAATRAARSTTDSLADKEREILNKRFAKITGKPVKEQIATPGTHVARTSLPQKKADEQRHHEEKLETFRRSQGPPVVPKLSPESVPPTSTGRPKMDDVKFTKKLSGPIDELVRMTLDEFRRLSKDPAEAIIKIEDKIDLLEDQSIDKKIKAIRAWQQSKVNKLYHEINLEVLETGKGMEETLKARSAAGKPSLSLDEVKAIRGLNAKLRY